jgi:hypothetical protein
MFPTKLLPLFALGCAPVPGTTDELATDPDPTVDPGSNDGEVDEPYEPADYEAMEMNEVRSKIWEHVHTLQGLQIVQVSDVVVDLPNEALCAYAWTACAGFEDVVDDALREVAPRLDALAHNAEVAANSIAVTPTNTCADAVVDANLDDLSDLEIINVGDLMVAIPERNCPYGLPCEEDIIAAQELTCERAATLDRLVESSLGL